MWLGLQQGAGTVEVGLARAIRQQPVVADPHEAAWQHMLEEATDELCRFQGHGSPGSTLGVVLVAEADLIVVDGEQAIVGDGDAVGMAGQVLEDLLRSRKGLLGVDHPIVAVEPVDQIREEDRVLELLQRAVEFQLPLAVRVLEEVNGLAPEDLGEDPHGQQDVFTAILGQPPDLSAKSAFSRFPYNRNDLLPGKIHIDTINV